MQTCLLLPLIHVNADLCEVVPMRSAQQRLVMRQVPRHGQDMVLNIAQVQPNLRFRRHFPLFVAPLRKTFDDVGFVAQ